MVCLVTIYPHLTFQHALAIWVLGATDKQGVGLVRKGDNSKRTPHSPPWWSMFFRHTHRHTGLLRLIMCHCNARTIVYQMERQRLLIHYAVKYGKSRPLSSLLSGPLAPAPLPKRATPHQIRTCERPWLGWRWTWNGNKWECVDSLNRDLNRRGNTGLIRLHKKPLNLRNVSALICWAIHVQLPCGAITRGKHAHTCGSADRVAACAGS